MSSIPPVSFGVQAYPAKKSQASRPATGVAFGTTQPLRFGHKASVNTNKPQGVWDNIVSFFTGIVRAIGRILGNTKDNGEAGNYAKYNDTWVYHSDVKDKLIARNTDNQGKFEDAQMDEMAKKVIKAVAANKVADHTGLSEDEFKNLFLEEGNPQDLGDLSKIFTKLSNATKIYPPKTEATKPAETNVPPADPTGTGENPNKSEETTGQATKTIGKFITPPSQEDHIKSLETRIDKLQKQKHLSLREQNELAFKTKTLASLKKNADSAPSQTAKPNVAADKPLPALGPVTITLNSKPVSISAESIQQFLEQNLTSDKKANTKDAALAILHTLAQTPEQPVQALKSYLGTSGDNLTEGYVALLRMLSGEKLVGSRTINPVIREVERQEGLKGYTIGNILVKKSTPAKKAELAAAPTLRNIVLTTLKTRLAETEKKPASPQNQQLIKYLKQGITDLETRPTVVKPIMGKPLLDDPDKFKSTMMSRLTPAPSREEIVANFTKQIKAANKPTANVIGAITEGLTEIAGALDEALQEKTK